MLFSSRVVIVVVQKLSQLSGLSQEHILIRIVQKENFGTQALIVATMNKATHRKIQSLVVKFVIELRVAFLSASLKDGLTIWSGFVKKTDL